MDDLAILILAAGASSRMRGRDKLLEPVHGAPLLRHLAQEALRLGAPLTVALPKEPGARGAALEGLTLCQVPVTRAPEGMGASLATGVSALPPCRRILLLLGDMPEITVSHLRAVLAVEAPVVRGAHKGRPGHPVAFDAALRPALEALSGDEGAKDLVAGATLVEIGPAALCDLDTPEAWAAWRTRREN